jgi:type II secretory pathway predicted ATPase ExeA
MLIQRARAGQTTVMIVDEAHNLEWDVLEEIRMLGNFESRKSKLLQIIMAGQPELDRKLDAPNLRQLKQRVVLRCVLQALTETEASEYIHRRLEHAGMPGQKVFPPEVITEIHRSSEGIPRLMNAICDNLLLNVFAQEKRAATVDMLVEVSKDLRLESPDQRRRPARVTNFETPSRGIY